MHFCGLYPAEALFILAGSFITDILIGDPQYSLHPTRIIGKLVRLNEKWCMKLKIHSLIKGIIFSLSTLVLSALSVLLGMLLLKSISTILLLIASLFITYSSVAFRDMIEHVVAVEKALKRGNTEAAREKLSLIVSRKTDKLDERKIIISLIESLSENFTDGFFSVVFYFVCGFFLGCALNINPIVTSTLLAFMFRVIDTMDSMVGYRSERYLLFGKFTAKLEDAASFIPARASVVFICLSSAITANNPSKCIQTVMRDRLKHPSPNAAHPESAFAGALQIKLGGSVEYPHGTVNKPHIGANFGYPEIKDLQKAIGLFCVSGVMAVFFASLALLFCGYLYSS